MQVFSGLLLLAVLIVFHELGHFLFAKMLGVRVLTFSLGFGPKLLGFKRGDTEYRVAAIPLGGYIRMFGESLEEELSAADKKLSFMHQPIWRKSLIALAGPLFNFILPVILFFFLIIGSESYFSPKIGTVLDGGAAALAGLRPGDTIKSIDNKAVISFSEVAKIVSEKPGEELDFLVQRQDLTGQTEQILYKIKVDAKQTPNVLEKEKVLGRIGIMPATQKAVIILSANNPLIDLGLKDFDEIISLNNIKINSAQELEAHWASINQGANIKIRRGQDKATSELSLTFAPGLLPMLDQKPEVLVSNMLAYDQSLEPKIANQITQTSKLLEREHATVAKNFGLSFANGGITKLEADSVASRLSLAVGDRLVSINGESLASIMQLQQSLLNGASEVQVLGVLKKDLSPVVLVFKLPSELVASLDLNSDLSNVFGISTAEVFSAGELLTRQVGIPEALSRAAAQTVDIAMLTAKSIWLLVKGEVPASQVGGPIMLFDVAQQAAKKGLEYYIFIMCLLSVNLGLLNLLPIPALDGGHLLLFSVEAIQRKPLTAKTRAIATQIGVAVVLFLMAFAIFNDLSRLFA